MDDVVLSKHNNKASSTGILTISVGYADMKTTNVQTIERLISQADRAMYWAKQHGKNRASGCLDVLDTYESYKHTIL